MDDLGAEHLSELSVCEKNVKGQESVTGGAASGVAIESKVILGHGFVEKSVSIPIAAPRRRCKDNTAIMGNYMLQNDIDEEEVSVSSSDGKEKTDATPENAKKIDDVIQVEKTEVVTLSESRQNEKCVNATGGMDSETDRNIEAGVMISNDDESSASSTKHHGLAFTIDFGDSSGNESNTAAAAAAAAKYKSMVERFQNRHRRGASMSKLESGTDATANVTPEGTSNGRATSALPPLAPDASSKVKIRPRDRSTSRVRDASKRHSWSPRSSTTEPPPVAQNQLNQKVTVPPKSPITASATKKVRPKPPAIQVPSHNHLRDKLMGRPFTPRSTAMQLALQKIDFLCPQPPLDDYQPLGINDNVSDAGTYTLDGDNYTEEQKELMNIDKATTATSSSISSGNHLLQQRPKDLPLKNKELPMGSVSCDTIQSRRRNNVLEVNYFHDPTSPAYKSSNKPSYLEKIKSKVRNIGLNPEKEKQKTTKQGSPVSVDIGTFTSVTTSGVLAKRATLDSNPKMTRRSSLSTSQIDSSEYVSAEAKLKSNSNIMYNGGYTDHQKAGYRLNVFTNQTDAQILSAIESPESPVSKLSDTAGLKTAQTKNDWIQEWARNARARSVASAIKTSPQKQSNTQQSQNDIMSRSYNCTIGLGEDDPLTDDNVIYRNKTIDRFRVGDFDYSSDPNVSAQKPPSSPTKIPSPRHTIGRMRSASHTRASLQNIIQDDANNTDLYLQKTAAAISNLQQSLSRNNSLQSPPSSRDSPKKVPTRHNNANHQYYSADEYSPQHSIEGKMFLSNPLHKKVAANLMTGSYHEQLVLEVKLPQPRKNSYDSQALTVSPARRHPAITNKQYYEGNLDQTRSMDSSIKQAQQQPNSPLRRSSSFSTKCRSTVANNGHQKRPSAPLYTPPAGRHKTLGQTPAVPAIKKSASSTTFRQVYSDYDDNLTYYINDEDDLVDIEYYGSSDEDNNSPNIDEDFENYIDDDVSQHVVSETSANTEAPLTNTRYNKALLMRIERSKQKVAAGNTPMSHKSNLLAVGGVAACPNTPELPRRAVKSAPRSSMRQSVPRDSSLNRLAQHIPNSLASAKKQILQTANTVNSSPSANASGGQQKRVQPKYLDISKYKPAQGNNFLRKNDAKSTLKPEIRRSPSSASMGLSRTEPTRTSNRSTKSTASIRGSSAAKRDNSVSKQKEVELAMWKRRATYDPMRAAAEDRRKKEEARKSALGSHSGLVADSSTVTRSQTFHSGIGTMSGNTQSNNLNQQPIQENRWGLTTNESSDEENAYITSIRNNS